MGIFDDIPSSGGRKGTFDDIPDNKPDGGLLAAAKQGIGQSIKGIGQAASDFIPGVSPQNPISQYGQSVVDANQTAVNSLGGIVDSPWTAVKEAVGNAAGSMGTMLGARVLGTGITAAAPFTGPAAPVVAGAGQIIANVGPIAAAALPSYSGIRETQIAADQGNEADAKSKAIAALGAATVGAIETKFGPQEWALQAMKKGGFGALKDKLGAETLRGAVGKGLVKGAAIEGAEELVQNPIEQLSGYQNPTTPEALQETAFGGAMGAIGGGVVGGGVSGIAHFAEKPKGPLQKAAEASSATVPTDAATIPPGGQTSATIQPEAAQPAGIPAGTSPADPETQPPAAGVASADQNTPAAPGISPVPVSTAEPPLPSNQAESAGVPVVDQQAPLSGEYLPASDGRAPFVIAGEIETGAIPGQFSRVYPETGQRRISQTRSITDQSQEGAAKSGNETEIPQP
ncbi:MAG TPA: hypothetical protein PLL19_14540, partial [Thiobacillaceae bacterium]|nr:hypothetical protein [Thiobacillaceae bacterium]